MHETADVHGYASKTGLTRMVGVVKNTKGVDRRRKTRKARFQKADNVHNGKSVAPDAEMRKPRQRRRRKS